MSIASLEQFKDFLRELTTDLDSPFGLALDAATAEVNAFLGFDAEEEFADSPPADIVMACMILAQVHADAGDVTTNEYRRTAAHRLLLPYRQNTGIGAAA